MHARICLAVLTISMTAGTALADWPNFRGPNHDGKSDETNFQKEWAESIPLVWERNVGSAFSSFACVGDRVFTCGTADGKQTILCMNALTGEVIWQQPMEEEYVERMGGDGPRATPTVHDGKVYILGALGTFMCLADDDGKIIWKHKFNAPPQWGYSASVLIEGDLAVTTGGKDEGSLVAFKRDTGDIVWKAGDDVAGYATPYPFEINGRRYIVGFTGEAAIIVESLTGKIVWRELWKTDWKVNAAAPIYHDGYLFLSSGYSTGCALYKLTSKPDGTFEGEQVWRSKVLRNKFQSCILHEGNLYTSDQRAMSCVDFLTGELRWQRRREKHGTLILADGFLIYLSDDGELQIGKASPSGFDPVTTAELLSGRCWVVPVLHKGRLYARNMERVACFDLRPQRDGE